MVLAFKECRVAIDKLILVATLGGMQWRQQLPLALGQGSLGDVVLAAGPALVEGKWMVSGTFD